MMEGTAGLGTSLGESISTVALVLTSCWADPRYCRERASEGILDQEIDKSSLLLLNTVREADPSAKYFPPSPFTIVPGRHGPGPALILSGGKPQFICDFIESMQQCFPEGSVFHISRPTGTSRYFEPVVSRVAWDHWKAKKPTHAVELVDQLGAILTKFSERQTIAFGRHPTPKDSREALNFLHRSFHTSLHAFLEVAPCPSREPPADARGRLDDLHSIALSGYAKVTEDGRHYSAARGIVLDSDETAAREALLGCRGAWEDIARDREWRLLAAKSRAFYYMARAVGAAFRIIVQFGDNGNRVSPLDELKLAGDGWSSEGASASLALPMEELSVGDFPKCGAALNSCVDGVMRSDYIDP
jgi:hypothetical protein